MFNADDLKNGFVDDLKNVKNEVQLSEFWKKFFSKQGSIQGLMSGIKNVAKEEKKAYGQFVNDVKTWAQELYDNKKAEIEKAALQARYKKEEVDVTVPPVHEPVGCLHPLTTVKYEMINVFAGMGFEIFEGPEIEDDDHNFTRLNVLKDHPSRDMQDTFWLTDDLLLRTHTSPGQIRKNLLSRCLSPVRYFAPIPTLHIHQCSASSKDWSSINISPSAIFRVCSMNSLRICSPIRLKQDSVLPISRLRNQALRSMSAASAAAARAARFVRVQAGSRYSAAVS